MGTFSTAFGLCSVTDSKGLLGVSGDDEGCAVITLGKSMVIRCRLSDQKQLNSWSTALAKLTSKVVWNAVDENYVGVFDNFYLKQWSKEDASLEKAKKHKFKNEIHEILLFSKQILKKPQLIILFKNGSIRDLESALKNSKEPVKEVIQPQEMIELADIIMDNDNKYLVVITKFENKYRQCYCVLLQKESFLVTDSVKKIKIRRQGSSLLGFVTLTGEKGNFLLTFWSDGFLYSLSLPLLESENPGVGKYLGAINVVSKESEVSIQAVSGDRIAIYGADPSEEGAFLGIYNVKFGVIQVQTNFKMFNKPPRMWLIENNLVTVMGQRLVCVPFHLQTETLSALVGSRALHENVKTPSEICTIVPTAVWIEEKERNKMEVDYPQEIREQLETFASEGWSEFGICQGLMTHLIEGKDTKTLSWCLANFTDIPENYLVKMILMALREDSEKSCDFINQILTTPVDDINLLKNLRETFSFEDCLSLVKYLIGLFSEEGTHGDVSVENSFNVLGWTTTLFDAFYQQLILSRDPKVLELIVVLKGKIEENVSYLKELRKLIPYVVRLKKGKGFEKKTVHRKSYYVERLRLYN